MLKNPVRVEALYDRDEAERATLTNLLQRQGYEDLEAVLAAGRSEGRSEGLASAVLAVLEARGIRITKAARERIVRCTDAAELDRWVRRAAVVERVAEMFDEGMSGAGRRARGGPQSERRHEDGVGPVRRGSVAPQRGDAREELGAGGGRIEGAAPPFSSSFGRRGDPFALGR